MSILSSSNPAISSRALDRPPLGRLCWFRKDIEQRFGVRGGRFTRTNGLLSFVLAVIFTVAAYAGMIPFHEHYAVQMFTERGPVQYVTVLFFFWAASILLVKSLKLRLQAKALQLDVVPTEVDFVLSKATAGVVLDRLHDVCDDPHMFVLLNRIDLGLANLKNMGRVGDLDDVLQSQAGNDEDAMESSYSMLRGLIWAIPVLGFIGTVKGLSQAVGKFGAVLAESVEISALKPALQGVTGGLSVAFETTYVSLVAAVAIQLALTIVKKNEEQFLDDCKEYCQRKLIRHLRLSPFEARE